MTNPTYFTVVADYKSVVVDLASDVDADPTLGPVTAKVTFTPILANGDVILATDASPRPTGYVAAPIVARIDTDGRLKLRVEPDGDRDDFASVAAFPSTGNTAKVYWSIADQKFYRWTGSAYAETYPYAAVRLLADTALLELASDLYYRVTFSEVVFNGGTGYIAPFTFQAPSTDVELNLIEVMRQPGQPASGITKIAPGAVRLQDGDVVFSFAGVDIPDSIPFEPSFTTAEITDASEVGVDLLTAVSASAARAAISAVGKGELVFNVKDYGAAGDGTTDDRAAIQAAINAAVAAGGGTVHLPLGDYKLTNKITLGSNVTLQGEGSGSALRPAFGSTNTTNRVIDNDWVNGSSNIALKHFKLDRSGNNVTHGVIVNGVNNLLIDGVEVSGYPTLASGAIAISGTLSNAGPPLLSKNVRVVNCYFSETGNFAVQPGFVDGCVIANNTAENCYREVFSCEPEDGLFPSVGVTGAYAKNVTISGNTCLTANVLGGTQTGAIVVTASSGGVVSGVSVTGNTVRQYGNDRQRVYFTGTVTGGTFTLGFLGETTGAIAWNASAATVQTALRALSTIGATGVNVSTAVIEPAGISGFVIDFQGALATPPMPSGSQLVATSSLTGTSPAIVVLGASPNIGILVTDVSTTRGAPRLSNVTITGNAVSDMGSHGIMVGVAGQPTNGVVISGNSVTNCTLSGIHLRHASQSIVTGNYVKGAQHTVASVQESNQAANNFIALNHLQDSVPVLDLYNAGTVVFGNKTATSGQGLTLGSRTGSFQSALNFDRVASDSTDSRIQFLRDSVLRWIVRNSGAESGSNAGSNIEFLARTDAGGTLGTALTLTRSDMTATFGGKVVANSTIELGNASDTTLSRSSAGVLAVEGVVVPTVSSTGTLTNKTIQGTRETVHTITDGAAFEIDPRNGGIQTVTLGASRTPKASNFAAGHSMMLMVAPTANTITWTDATLNPTWIGGAAPALSATQQTVISLWEVGTTIYGALIGYA